MSQDNNDKTIAELQTEKARLNELEEKAYTGPYQAKWWFAKRKKTELEKRLHPEKHFDDLPGASMPEGILIEKDVPVEMSDGVKLAANVFRPDKPGRFPVIMTFTPYSKDYYGQHDDFGCSVMTPFEAPDPGYWVPNDYVMIHVDDRATGKSPGVGVGGTNDLYDGIEWAARQEWSNGNISMIGHSALAMRQWEVASMEVPPPHLKAIIPWGGFNDRARDNNFPGGIPETEFNPGRGENIPLWQENFQPLERSDDPQYQQLPPDELQNPPKLENIRVPMLIGSTWVDYYAHLQGNFRGWLRASSQHKWLYTYSLRKWQGLYTPIEARDMQRKFLDYFLKGIDNDIMEIPRVRLSVQDKLLDFKVRYEKDFPLRRTVYTSLYLDARGGVLSHEKPEETAKVSYNSDVSPVSQVIHQEPVVGPEGKASFQIAFDEETEITGFMKLKLWVSPEDTNDMDIFVTVRKYNADGFQVCFDSDGAPGRMPVAVGWMRLSKRELDEELSKTWLPIQKSVLPDGPVQKVKAGEVIPCEIAIWPSCTVFHAGEKLVLDISGKYGIKDDLLRGYNNLINKGRHSIYTGGKYDSHLLVPVIPEATRYSTFGGRQVVEN
ncbi:MAG: CocE/NonD family hydrolase [Dehalococcoidales bacterium]|nr:MAG: CocE/NonD family hydrolase [Dehalococcoidales bacterium]